MYFSRFYSYPFCAPPFSPILDRRVSPPGIHEDNGMTRSRTRPVVVRVRVRAPLDGTVLKRSVMSTRFDPTSSVPSERTPSIGVQIESSSTTRRKR